MATIYGDTGNNTLNGTADSDRIYGLAGNDSLSGSDGNDTLIGGNGNDFLVGRDGNDVLTGGTGADDFAFNSPIEGIDTIKGFNVSEEDKIQVYAGGFGGGLTTTGSLSSDQFTIGSAAADASDRFIYNASTGGLFFDSDGTGSLEQLQFATLSPGLSLSGSDIYVTAPAFTDSSLLNAGLSIGLAGAVAAGDALFSAVNNPTLAPIKIIFP